MTVIDGTPTTEPGMVVLRYATEELASIAFRRYENNGDLMVWQMGERIYVFVDDAV